MTHMGLDGPSVPVKVEPVTLPAPAREPAKAPSTPTPTKEPVKV